jgi:hypothetical protein
VAGVRLAEDALVAVLAVLPLSVATAFAGGTPSAHDLVSRVYGAATECTLAPATVACAS